MMNAGNRHGNEGAESARRHGDAGADGGIAEERLENERNEHGSAVEADAEQRHEKNAGGVSAVFEDAQIDDGIFNVKLVDREMRRA